MSREIDGKAMVSKGVVMEGEYDITIEAFTLVHPSVHIHAKAGPIHIGKYNILEEGVKICNNDPHILRIGDDNLLSVQSEVYGAIGNENRFDIRSRVSPGQESMNGCYYGVGIDVNHPDIKVDHMVIAGKGEIAMINPAAYKQHISQHKACLQTQMSAMKKSGTIVASPPCT